MSQIKYDIQHITNIIYNILYIYDDDIVKFFGENVANRTLNRDINEMVKQIKIIMERRITIEERKIILKSYLNNFFINSYSRTIDNKIINYSLFINKNFHINQIIEYIILQLLLLALSKPIEPVIPTPLPEPAAPSAALSEPLPAALPALSAATSAAPSEPLPAALPAALEIEPAGDEELLPDSRAIAQFYDTDVYLNHRYFIMELDDSLTEQIKKAFQGEPYIYIQSRLKIRSVPTQLTVEENSAFSTNTYLTKLIAKQNVSVVKRYWLYCMNFYNDLTKLEDQSHKDSALSNLVLEYKKKCIEFMNIASKLVEKNYSIFYTTSESYMCSNINSLSINSAEQYNVNLEDITGHINSRKYAVLSIIYNYFSSAKEYITNRKDIYLEETLWPLIGSGAFGKVILLNPTISGVNNDIMIVMKTFDSYTVFEKEKKVSEDLSKLTNCNLIESKVIDFSKNLAPNAKLAIQTSNGEHFECCPGIILMNYAPSIDMYDEYPNKQHNERMRPRDICNVIYSLLKNVKCLYQKGFLYTDYKTPNTLWTCYLDYFREIQIGDIGDIINLTTKTNIDQKISKTRREDLGVVVSYPPPEYALYRLFSPDIDMTVRDFLGEDFILWGICVIVMELLKEDIIFLNLRMLDDTRQDFNDFLRDISHQQYKQQFTDAIQQVRTHIPENRKPLSKPKNLRDSFEELYNLYIMDYYLEYYVLYMYKQISKLKKRYTDRNGVYFDAIYTFIESTLKMKRDMNTRGTLDEHIEAMRNVLTHTDIDGIEQHII